MPIAVVVDLDYVRRSEPAMRRSGIGDAITNLSAIADWRLAERERGETVDGVAVTFARTGATSIMHRSDGIDDDGFLYRARRGARAVRPGDGGAGSSRPCSGADHEILHAIDHLFPGTRNHGELAGAASLFTVVPARRRRATRRASTPAWRATACRARPPTSGSPRSSSPQAVLHAPATRPDRYTILEHLGLDEQEVQAACPTRTSAPSIAELRAVDPAAVDLRAQQRRALGRAAVHAPAVAVPDAAAAAHRGSRRTASRG